MDEVIAIFDLTLNPLFSYCFTRLPGVSVFPDNREVTLVSSRGGVDGCRGGVDG